MKNRIIKVCLSMMLFISIFVFALNPDSLKVVQETGQHLLEILQEFVKRDVVGII